MKIKLPTNYELTGPYLVSSAPYGKTIESLNKHQWFLSRYNISKEELKRYPPDYSQIFNKYGKCIGHIEQFENNSNRYLLPQTYPLIEFPTLQEIVQYLIDNEGKIVYLS